MVNFNGIFDSVLNEILGEPNKTLSTKNDLRFGKKGSLSFDTRNLIWFDHERSTSGGFLDLIKDQTGVDGMSWLITHGYTEDTRKTQKEGLSLSLKPAPTPKKESATYVYATKEGQPLYRLIRDYESGNRTFIQQRFDNSSGQWLAGLKDAQGNNVVEKTLFNLPELASRQNDDVFIVEGEKDVMSLKTLGLLATTSGGAKSWRNEFAQLLNGRNVVVVPDFDLAGKIYADSVIQSLKGVAKSIKRLELSKHWTQCPLKADITDFFEAGGQASDLLKMIEQTGFEGAKNEPIKAKPAVTFERACDALKNAMKPIPWLVEGFFIKDTLTALVGKPSAGKSLISLSLAASVATGSDWFGNKTQKGDVVYIAGEGQWGISRRLAAWSKHNNVSLDNADLFLSSNAVMVDQPKAIVDTADAIRAFSNAPALIVVDTLHRSFSGDENSASDMAAFIQGCDYLRTQFKDSVVLIVHHSGHGNEVRARGSSSFHAAVDTGYVVEGSGDVKLMVQNKTKDGKPAHPIKFAVKEVDIFDGEQSITIEQSNDNSATSKALSKPLVFAVQAFAKVSYQSKATLETWRESFYESHHGETQDSKRVAFNRSRKDLVEAKVMTVENDIYELLEDHPYQKFTSGIMISANFKTQKKVVSNDDDFNQTA